MSELGEKIEIGSEIKFLSSEQMNMAKLRIPNELYRNLFSGNSAKILDGAFMMGRYMFKLLIQNDKTVYLEDSLIGKITEQE